MLTRRLQKGEKEMGKEYVMNRLRLMIFVVSFCIMAVCGIASVVLESIAPTLTSIIWTLNVIFGICDIITILMAAIFIIKAIIVAFNKEKYK